MPRPTAYDDKQFHESVRANAPAGTSEVADTVGCSRPLAHDRLNELAAEGKLKRKQIGKVVVWYHRAE